MMMTSSYSSYSSYSLFLAVFLFLSSSTSSPLPVGATVVTAKNEYCTDTEGGGWFKDMSKDIMPAAWYELRHQATVYYHFGAPLVTDYDGDGVLDVFTNNHHSAKQCDDPKFRWDFALGSIDTETGMVSYTDVAQDVFDFEVEHDPDTGKEIGINCKRPLDAHGFSLLDVTGDYKVDLLSVTGKDLGVGHGALWDAVFLEGSKPKVPGGLNRLVGGREKAAEVGLEMRNARGRGVFWADINNDGLLDLIPLNDIRMDERHVPGNLYLNQGNGTFKQDESFAEYAQTMVITDADGDGLAREVAFNRWKCLHDNKVRQKREYSKEWMDFCAGKQRGTNAIYAWNAALGAMEELTPKNSNVTEEATRKVLAMSMLTGDWDGDLLTDHLVMYRDRLEFWYSSMRNGSLPLIGDPHEIVGEWRDETGPDECQAESLRMADLDNDGIPELFIMCNPNDNHRIYTQKYHGAGLGGWIRVHGDLLGDLTSMGRRLIDPTDMTCDPKTLPALVAEDKEYERMCDAYNDGSKHISPKGVTIADLDNDGFPEVMLAHHLSTVVYFKNMLKCKFPDNRFFAIKVVGKESNTHGIGAIVILEADGMGPYQNETHVQLRELSTASHASDRTGGIELRVVFGLGAAGEVTRVVVKWPNGVVDIVANRELLRKKTNIMADDENSKYYDRLLTIKQGKFSWITSSLSKKQRRKTWRKKQMMG